MIEVIVHFQIEGGSSDFRTTFQDDDLEKAEKMILNLQDQHSGFHSGVIEHISSEGRAVLQYIEK